MRNVFNLFLAIIIFGIMRMPAYSQVGSTQVRQAFEIVNDSEAAGGNKAKMVLQMQVAQKSAHPPSGDVVYVHGATFGVDLSVFHRLEGRSWADALTDTGFNVWGGDFLGYGLSDPYPKTASGPAGRMAEAVKQLHLVVSFIRKRNGDKPVLLVAHSWGASTAILYASQHPSNVKGLVLFAPVITRKPPAAASALAPPPAPPAVYPLSALSQYRRFVEDVPKGQAQVLNEVQFQQWATSFLATDKSSAERSPPSVMTPFGPVADIMAMWSGQRLYDATLVKAPTLLVRGAWDSLCTDADASTLIAELGAMKKTDVKIDRATHLMHLETERIKLYQEVNHFLESIEK